MSGGNTDREIGGAPIRPSPMDTAYLVWEWDPRTDGPDDLDVPPKDSCAITPRTVTKDKNTHVGIEPGDIPAFSRIYGYVASLGPSPSDNTTTGYRVEIVFKFPPLYNGHIKAANGLSHIFARIRTYDSNALTTTPMAVMLGDVVFGVTAANYGGHGLANLGVRKLSDVAEWARMSPDTLVPPPANSISRTVS